MHTVHEHTYLSIHMKMYTHTHTHTHTHTQADIQKAYGTMHRKANEEFAIPLGTFTTGVSLQCQFCKISAF